MNKKKFQKEFLSDQVIACGRTVEEQVEDVENTGSHGVNSVLRNKLLKGLRVKTAKAEAENGIIFSCYLPFDSPYMVSDYVKLLDILNIDYTWFEKEYCCGWPIVGQYPDKIAIGEQFSRRNIVQADEKNVNTLAYCCVGCAYAVRHMVKDSSKQLVYILDIILDAMEKQPNKFKIKPVTLGYFEGCHSWYQYNFPKGTVNWERYRRALDMIDGLTVVDLPKNLCCKRSGEQIIEKAKALNIEGIVCPCNTCHKVLLGKAEDQISILSYPEILLQSMAAMIQL